MSIAPEQPRRDRAVFVGRFQPFHNGHLHIVRADDADAAVWTPPAEVRREDMFGDHFHIIHAFATRVGAPGWEDR